MAAPSQRVVIRKYGNRRLYNTSASRYINLEELAALVRNGKDVQVLDAKTGEDLTRVTLTQIIVEDAKDEQAALPLELLRQLIVASNHVGRDFVMWYLKSAFDAYRKFEGALQSSVEKPALFSPLQMVKNLIGPSAAPDTGNAELGELKRRIADLEKKKRPARRARIRKPSPAAKRTGRKR